jgi:WD40 repeat protein
VAALTWHPRLPLLAVAAHTDARIFDLRRDPDSVTHPGINCLRRHPRRNLFAAGGMGGELIIFDPAEPAARHTFEAHEGGVRSVAFAPSDERLLTITEQGPMLLWDLRDVDQGEITATSVRCPVRLPGAAAWSPDGALVAVGGDKQVVLLDPQRQLEELRRFDVPNLVNGLDVDPSGTWIAVATSGSDIGVYSTTGEPARWLTSHMSSVGSVRWVDDRHLASAGYDGQVIIWSPWDEATDGVLRRIDPGGGAVWDIAVSRTAIVTVTSAGLLGLHPLKVDGPNCIVALDTALSSCDVSANGMALAAGGSAGTFVFSIPNWAAGTRDGSTPCLDDRPARRGRRASS